MDRIRQAQVFIQVVESGNFTSAAKALNLPKSTISTAIQALEDRLGAQLFLRTTRRVTLTHDGLRYLELARQLVTTFEAAEGAFQHSDQSAKGRLRVDMPSRIARLIVIPALPSFLNAHPGIELELSMTDRLVDLLSEGVDFVLRVGTPDESGVFCRKLGAIELINCACPAYLARHGNPMRITDLAEHHIVNYAVRLPSPRGEWEYAKDSEIHRVPIRHKVTVDNAEAYIASAVAGLGIIQIPKFDVQDLLADGDLVEIMPNFRPPAMQLSFLYSSRRNLAPRVRIFQDWLAGQLSSSGIVDGR